MIVTHLRPKVINKVLTILSYKYSAKPRQSHALNDLLHIILN